MVFVTDLRIAGSLPRCFVSSVKSFGHTLKQDLNAFHVKNTQLEIMRKLWR